MAAYFNPADADDLKLLHSSVRTNAELANVAARVETDVIRYYSEYDSASTSYVVALRGYAADADQAEATFKAAMKQTIADLISFQLRSYSNEPGVKALTRGKRNWNFGQQAGMSAPTDQSYEPGWNYRLTIFDTREVVYGI